MCCHRSQLFTHMTGVNNTRVRLFATLILVTLLTACTQWGNDSKAVDVFNFDLSQQDLAFQLKSKHGEDLTSARLASDRQILSFIERNAMAEVIMQDPQFDKQSLSSELVGIRNELIIKKYLSSIESTVASDAEVKSYFDDNKDRFARRKVKVGQIFFRTSQRMKPEEISAIKVKAESVLDQLKNGAEFEAMAIQYSDDKATAKKGGDLGWVTSEQSRHSILSKAMELNESEVSSLINSNNGFYIIKALEGPIVEDVSFEAVKARIAYDLKYQSKIKKMGELKKKAASRIAKDYQRFQIKR